MLWEHETIQIVVEQRRTIPRLLLVTYTLALHHTEADQATPGALT